MQRLLPIAFDSLPKSIWKFLIKLSLFFRELSSTTLNVEYIKVMEEIYLCYCVKWNKYFHQASLIPWNIFQFIYLMRQNLVVQSNTGGFILLRGIKLLFTFTPFIIYFFNILNDAILYYFLGSYTP